MLLNRTRLHMVHVAESVLPLRVAPVQPRDKAVLHRQIREKGPVAIPVSFAVLDLAEVSREPVMMDSDVFELRCFGGEQVLLALDAAVGLGEL